jgi:hypothetical protein
MCKKLSHFGTESEIEQAIEEESNLSRRKLDLRADVSTFVVNCTLHDQGFNTSVPFPTCSVHIIFCQWLNWNPNYIGIDCITNYRRKRLHT